MPDLLQHYQTSASSKAGEAHCLPFEVYRNPAIWQEEARRIFHNDWVFICCEQELKEAGSYYAFELAGESLAIIRQDDNSLVALSNVCRHRGTPLLETGFGTTEKLIVCPYHAWAYEKNGDLKAIPLAGKNGPDKKEHCLPVFRLESWHGLLFINLNSEAEPLMQRLDGIDDYLSGFDLAEFKAGNTGAEEYWQSNWKLAMENAMESYHLFKVHKETLETTTPTRGAFYLAGSSEWSLTAGKINQPQSKLMKWLSGDYPEMYNHYVLVSLPPSFVGILTYYGFDWIQVLPINENESFIRSGGIAKSTWGYNDKKTQEFTDAFFAEDKAICERVQRGMNSTHTQGGKLVDMERILVDFHQYLASRLFNSEPDTFYQSDNADMFLNPK